MSQCPFPQCLTFQKVLSAEICQLRGSFGLHIPEGGQALGTPGSLNFILVYSFTSLQHIP